MSTATTIVNNTIRKLRARGWIRKAYHTEQGYCLVGALRASRRNEYGQYVAANDQSVRDVHRAVEAVIAERSQPARGLEYWNDNVAQDVDEVIEVLKLAKERIEGSEDPQ